jgi:hypothetical protein
MAEQEKEGVQHLYVDLDALLDTRLATLALIDPKLVPMALEANYFERQVDEFPLVDSPLFKKLYETRDRDILSQAGFTKVLKFLQETVRQLYFQTLDTPFTSEILVDVNIYPYVLKREELEALMKCLMAVIGKGCAVRFIRKSDEELTPKLCNETYSLMVRYQYDKWIDEMCKDDGKDIRRYRLSGITLIGPQIFIRKPTPNEIANFRAKKQDPFRLTERLFSPIINLQLITLSTFCIDVDAAINDIFT